MLAAGCLGFVWLFPAPAGVAHRLTLGPPLRIILGTRFGLGFVHFLYSRWVWGRGGVGTPASPPLLRSFLDY
jgi:hypothetical protein